LRLPPYRRDRETRSTTFPPFSAAIRRTRRLSRNSRDQLPSPTCSVPCPNAFYPCGGMFEDDAVERHIGALNAFAKESICSDLPRCTRKSAAELLPKAETRKRRLLAANVANRDLTASATLLTGRRCNAQVAAVPPMAGPSPAVRRGGRASPRRRRVRRTAPRLERCPCSSTTERTLPGPR
jgi:hypothetical protein